MPSDVLVQMFVRPSANHLIVLVRLPLISLLNINLPKRGEDFLDLAAIEPSLRDAAQATADAVDFFEDGNKLATPRIGAVQVSLPSDPSFTSYQSALAHDRICAAFHLSVWVDDGVLDSGVDDRQLHADADAQLPLADCGAPRGLVGGHEAPPAVPGSRSLVQRVAAVDARSPDAHHRHVSGTGRAHASAEPHGGTNVRAGRGHERVHRARRHAAGHLDRRHDRDCAQPGEGDRRARGRRADGLHRRSRSLHALSPALLPPPCERADGDPGSDHDGGPSCAGAPSGIRREHRGPESARRRGQLRDSGGAARP